MSRLTARFIWNRQMIYAGFLSVLFMVADSSGKTEFVEVPLSRSNSDWQNTSEFSSNDAGEFCRACDRICVKQPGKVWFTAEYLLWKIKPMETPVLVSAASAGVPIDRAGTLGDSSTQTLFGGTGLNRQFRSGLRFGIGYWLDECETCAIEGGSFWLGSANDSGIFSSNGSPGLFRPFTNAATGNQATELVAFNGVLAGSVAVDTGSQLCGYDIGFRKLLCCEDGGRLEWQFGYEQLSLRESVAIFENLLVTAPDPNQKAPNGSRFFVQDSFKTNSTFYGPRIGLTGFVSQDNVFIQVRSNVGVGVNRNIVDIEGSTVATTPAGVATLSQGGLLALATNMGRHLSTDFSVVSDASANIGYQINDHLGVFAGYSFLYWTGVVRAGQQIDSRVNPAYIPGSTGSANPRLPAVLFDRSDLWVQGVNISMRLSW